jgi:AcrR family transcriptional regulator
MPKVSDEYKESKRREIAEAAMRAFERKGFQAASMSDIIAESGASAGAIYGAYRSKAEIVHVVATTLVNDRLLAGEEYLTRDPLPVPGEVVGLMMRSLAEAISSTDILVQLWGEAITDPELREITSTIMDRFEAAYRGYLIAWHEKAHGLPTEAASDIARRVAPLFVSMSQGYIIQSALRDDFDGEAYLAAAAEFLPR